MAEKSLNIERRIESGTSNARRLRRMGRIPAVIYGGGIDTVPITLNEHAFELLLKQGRQIWDLEFDNLTKQVIVRDIQRHPVSDKVIHVDFYEIRSGQKLTLSVRIHFEGKALGVKEGGIFQTVKDELEISVLPTDIPNFITVDISNLAMGENIRVKDVKVEKMEILDDPEDVLCRIQIPKTVEEEELAVAPEEEVVEPEVITAKEREEEPEAEK